MRFFIFFTTSFLCGLSSSQAGFVTPKIGGGQVDVGGAVDMIHLSVKLSGTTVEVSPEAGTPTLRALEEPDEFDLAEPWGVLGTKAYNFQYGWLADNSGSFPPVGAWFWIEQLSASAGLEVYQRPPATPAYEPIFGTDGSSTRWYWSGLMSHNVYAVQDPSLNSYAANYRVYIGNEVTGEPIAGYTAAEITLNFHSTPMLTADFDDDNDVDLQDLLQWEGDFMQNGDSDADGDGDSDGLDFLAWQRQLGSDNSASFAAAAVVVPEPGSSMLMITLLAAFLCCRRKANN